MQLSNKQTSETGTYKAAAMTHTNNNDRNGQLCDIVIKLLAKEICNWTTTKLMVNNYN